MTNTTNERKIILDSLIEILEGGRYSHLVLREALDKNAHLDKRKRAFITRITQGTLEHLIELDFIINKFSKTKVKKMKPVMRNVLRMTLYQMKYMDSVPHAAAIDEGVKLIKKRGLTGLAPFANGVLRNISREMDTIEMPGVEDGSLCISVKYSIPLWVADMWLETYDMDTVEQICGGFLENSGTFVRINLHKIEKQDLLTLLEGEGVQVNEHPYLDYALEISGYDSLNTLASFQAGLYQVQDLSSMMVAEVACPKAKDYVIDVCAAPGGKSLHMADKMAGTGMVEARDLTPYKVDLLEDNIRRTGLKNMRARAWDATVLDEKSIGKADIVVADLPCSGLGIMGKKPDLKVKAKMESLEELSTLQKEILLQVVQYLKTGGVLVYSTCTINKKENQEVAAYIREELGLRPLDIKDRLPKDLRSHMEEGNQLQLLPGVHACDGFFIAAFVKS